MLNKQQARELISNYINGDSEAQEYRRYRQQLTDNFEDCLSYFPNKRTKILYRGYVFRSSNSNNFYKKLLDGLKGKLNINTVSSWSSDLETAISFFDGFYSPYSDYSLLFAITIKPNAAIDIDDIVKDSPIGNDEKEFILPPVKLTKVDLIAAYSEREQIYWCNTVYSNLIRKYAHFHAEKVPFFDFIRMTRCFSEFQKDALSLATYSY